MSSASTTTSIALSQLQWEDQIVTLLSQRDLVELAKVLFQRCLISDTASTQFDLLDVQEMDSRVAVCYLLKQVSLELLDDETKYERFLSILDDGSASTKELCAKLSSSARQGGNLEAEEGEDVTELSASDANLVVELLVCVSHKWELIAVAIGLRRNVYENCRRQDNNISLSNMIDTWLSRGNEHSKCTLAALKWALMSELVGEHNMGSELAQRFAELKRSGSSCNVAATQGVNDSPFTIVMQSHHTRVADGKSTLLMVQASPRDSVTYQWKKDGQPLVESPIYCGVQDDILIINQASQTTVGEYTCSVHYEEKNLCTNRISLTTLYPPGKERLLNLYNACSEVPPDSWPPVGARTFINLALVKSKNECTEMGDYSVLGDADNTIGKKEKVEYNDLLVSFSNGELILLEGRPGCGKTTLVHKIVKDWAAGKVLRQARLVFLVSLRIFNSGKFGDEKLSEILSIFFRNEEELKLVIERIEKGDGKGICFIFDGLDEYRSQNRDKSVIFALLQKKYLPQAMIVVSSRPTALADLRNETIDKRVEVFGFFKKQIFEYINSFPFSASDSSDSPNADAVQLNKYLDAHPNLLNMCYLPVHAAMICYLYKCKKGDIPYTASKIYVQFSHLIVLRYLARYSKDLKVHSELSEHDMKNFTSLCHIAFKMTVLSKQVIDPAQIGVDFVCDSKDHSLGLVTVDRTAELSGLRDTYTFLHLTFQEFLAAVHISKLEVDVQVEIIKKYSTSRNMQAVWKFYCGLVDFRHRPDRFELLIDSPELKPLVKIGYAYESQQKIFGAKVAKKLDLTFALVDSMFFDSLSHYDLLAIGYMVSCSQISHLNFTTYHLDDDKVKTLFLQLKKSLRLLEISSPIGELGVQGLIVFLATVQVNNIRLVLCQKLSSVQLKKIFGTLFGVTGILWLSFSDTCVKFESVFAHFSPHQSLHTVVLTYGNINAIGVAQLMCKLVEFCPGLYKLDLTHNKFDSLGVSVISKYLPGLKNLRELYLQRNEIDVNGALEILRASKELQHLCLLLISGRFYSEEHKSSKVRFIVEHMISPDDAVSMRALVNSTKHLTQDRLLCLGFTDILVLSSDKSSA